MFKHLLVPLDGSRMAESALPAAKNIAQKFHSGVRLLHIVEEDAPSEIHGDRHLVDREEALAFLQKVSERDFPEDIQVEIRIEQDQSSRVAQKIAEISTDLNADLIVMCTHGHGGLKQLLFGSIAQQVLTSAVIPILLVPPLSGSNPPPFACRQILVPLDGTPDHEMGLQAATVLARVYEAAIHILLVVRTSKTLTEKEKASAKWMPNASKFLVELREQAAEKYLEKQMEGLEDQRLTIQNEVRRGDPAEIVLKVSREKNIDIIVLGTHGIHGAAAFWSESVTPKICSRSRVPLLLIPVHDI
jgi:nucleotide-binding universal stress UspA family protein